MRPDMDRHGAEIMQLAQQQLAVMAGGEIGLVIPEPGIDRPVRCQLVAEVHSNVDRLRQCATACQQRGQHQSLKSHDPPFARLSRAYTAMLACGQGRIAMKKMLILLLGLVGPAGAAPSSYPDWAYAVPGKDNEAAAPRDDGTKFT